MPAVRRGIVNFDGVEYAYIYHWGGKSVWSLADKTHLPHWSTRAGNFDECPAIIRERIEADIKALEVEKCIQGV